ncbi:hypothetical protein FJR38_13800 [Anabaena sp. UHCC 0253]|uniref:hypothetical protein n=1 Tax=Anabaena sp. UHCC 0253 TaxID=2590019 RepID=UPI001445F132|nr:hypothetical protein [Anabaena sp. UHCC 0253]MTJ53641.1 hypothetical protein [Anabaena sp. UHCC 0253]
MIVFNNIFELEAPMQILLQIDEPDTEGWRNYRMALVINKDKYKLVEFEQSFSSLCIERLQGGINDLLEARTEQFDFEPLEPAFRLQVSRLAPDEFEMLCIVDISYVRKGPATETGIGMAIVVKADEVKSALKELNGR